MNITRKLKRSVLTAKTAPLCPPPTTSAPWAVGLLIILIMTGQVSRIFMATGILWNNSDIVTVWCGYFVHSFALMWLCDAVILSVHKMTCSSLEFPVAWTVVRASDQCWKIVGSIAIWKSETFSLVFLSPHKLFYLIIQTSLKIKSHLSLTLMPFTLPHFKAF